jgi:YidC/Oxa1 family membrane protein insertase
VRGALFPLNRRSQTSMARYQKKMKRVQPSWRSQEALRGRSAEAARGPGAHHAGGGRLPAARRLPADLPADADLLRPVRALRTSFDLRQAPFAFWIHDLSRPDHLLQLELHLPLIDLTYLNVLPILMVVLWILQQMGMPKPADEQAARMQKMMMFMPALFGFMLYNYAAGLSLYMITTSSCSIVEQKVIKKVWPIDDTEVARKEKPGCGPFSGIMQNLAEKQKEQLKRMQAMQQEQRRLEARKGKRR